jgi:hypothetical protein
MCWQISCPATDDTPPLVNGRVSLYDRQPSSSTARSIIDQKALTPHCRSSGCRRQPRWRESSHRRPRTAVGLDKRHYGAAALLDRPVLRRQCRVRAVLDIQHGRVPRNVVNRDVLDSELCKRRLARLSAAHGG